MRKVIVFLLSLFYSQFVFSYSTLELNLVNVSQRQRLDLIQGSLTNNFSNVNSTLNFTKYGLFEGLDLGIGLNETSLSPNKIFVNLKNGESEAISKEDSVLNYSTSLFFDYGFEDYRFFGSTVLPIKWKYFNTKSYSFGLSRGLYNETSIFSLNYTHNSNYRPLSYYTDPTNFKRVQSSQSIDQDRFTFVYEQVLSSKIKSNMSFAYNLKNQERPEHQAYSFALAYAPVNSWYFKSSFTRTRENHDNIKALRSSLGFLTNSTISLEITHELLYDLLVSFGYDLIIEKIKDSRLSSESQIGVDQYGLGINYKLSSVELSLRGSYFNSNASSNGLNFFGGLIWSL